VAPGDKGHASRGLGGMFFVYPSLTAAINRSSSVFLPLALSPRRTRERNAFFSKSLYKKKIKTGMKDDLFTTLLS
jgi:hypothetical protein